MNKASESKIGNKNPAWKGGPVERTCQTCGNIFLAIRAKIPGNSYSDRTGAKSKYCSIECSAKSQIKSQINKACLSCGTIFSMIPAKSEKAKYCSEKCKHNGQIDKVTKSCLICQNDFKVIKARESTAKYCSHKCHSLGNTKTIEHCKEVQNKHVHLRRARKNGAEGHFTEDEWALLKRQYHHRCLCCGRQEPDIKLTKDHIVPLSKGGTNWIANIQPLCRSCNSRKNNRIISFDLT